MESGLSFVDDPQMSVREKIDRYFQKKSAAIPVEVLDESTSDESFVDSFCNLDESFAEILINNPHVTLIRNAKKGNVSEVEEPKTKQQTVKLHTPQTTLQARYEDKLEETFREEQPPVKSRKTPYMPTPTRRGQVRRPIKTDESDQIDIDPYSLWFVSDESFLEMEKSCESPRKNSDNIAIEVNDTTLLDDVQAPSFLVDDSDLDDSVFEFRPSISMLSPMKQVALRRPSTILEESTIQSINSSEERSGCSSLSLKQSVNVAEDSVTSVKSRSYRPSLVNVFPTRSRIGFYDTFDSPSTAPSVQQSGDKENSFNLMTFENVDQDDQQQQLDRTLNPNVSISLMRFDSINEASSSNLSVDQTQLDSSMSDSEPPDQFNDTLEAVDYYMKQGKKILDKTGASTTLMVHQQPCVVSSPKNRNNSLLKQTLARRHLMSMNTGDTSKLANKKLF